MCMASERTRKDLSYSLAKLTVGSYLNGVSLIVVCVVVTIVVLVVLLLLHQAVDHAFVEDAAAAQRALLVAQHLRNTLQCQSISFL